MFARIETQSPEAPRPNAFSLTPLPRGARLYWAALLSLGAAAAPLFGVLHQPPSAFLLVALLVAGALVQVAAAIAVILSPTPGSLIVAAAVQVVALGTWFLSRAFGLPIGGAAWRPETLGAMDYYLPALEGLAAVLFIAELGRTLPTSAARRLLTALPLVLAAGVVILAALNSTLTILMFVVFFTAGFSDSLPLLFLPAAALLLAFALARWGLPQFRARTPGYGRLALKLTPALLLTSMLTWGAASTAADRAWLPTPAPVNAAPGQTTTLTYCSPNGAPLAMDLTEPNATMSRPVPVVFYVHGGEGLVGDRELQGSEGPYFSWLRDQLASRGFAVGSIDYGLAPGYHLVDQVDAAKCAVRFLRANAAALGIDPNRVGVYGDSQGGYLSAMLGVTGSNASFDVGQYSGQSSRVEAVVDMWGFTDLTNWSGSPSWVSLLGAGLTGGSTPPALKHALSPINDVAPGDPPFLIIHGSDDWFIAPHHSQDFARRLQQAGVPATLVMVQHGGHGLASPTAGQVQQPSPDDLVRMIATFFVQTLAPGS